MPKTALVPLAPGFEEIEATTVVDVLRRAGVDVLTASLKPGPVRGAHEIEVVPDTALKDVKDRVFDLLVLPGGMPGAAHLRDDQEFQEILVRLWKAGTTVAAICAAPMALGPSGLTAGRTVTCYPGFEGRFPHGPFKEDRVVMDGSLITSRGPGTALEFALTLVARLCGQEKAEELGRAMLVKPAIPPGPSSPHSWS